MIRFINVLLDLITFDLFIINSYHLFKWIEDSKLDRKLLLTLRKFKKKKGLFALLAKFRGKMISFLEFNLINLSARIMDSIKESLISKSRKKLKKVSMESLLRACHSKQWMNQDPVELLNLHKEEEIFLMSWMNNIQQKFKL